MLHVLAQLFLLLSDAVPTIGGSFSNDFVLAGGTVPPGGTCVYRVNVTAATGTTGTFNNPIVTVISAGRSPISSVQVPIQVVATVPPTPTKAFDTDFVVVNQTATMTVSIPGVAGLTAVQFSDTGERVCLASEFVLLWLTVWQCRPA